VAHDLHPQYLSTKFALEMAGLPSIGVQHHHAHVASCMAENRLLGQVIGVAFDGTGYGTDGAIWGGEFLVAGFAGFERRAHFRYVPMAGGDAAVANPGAPPWATSPIRSAPTSPLRLRPRARSSCPRMIAGGFNTVQASSCGRLFDAVASLIGLRHRVTFEGQAAIELEAIAADGCTEHYPYGVEGDGPWQVDFRPAIEAIVRDVAFRIPPATMAAKFHNTLALATVEVCRRIGTRQGCHASA